MKHTILMIAAITVATTAYAGWDPEEDTKITQDCEQAIATFKATDDTLAVYFDEAYGYAVIPSITKGGFIVGGARGKGKLYQNGEIVGDVNLTSGSFGLQAGVEKYSEIVFFKDEAAINRLKSGGLEFDAKATAVAATQGAAANADYASGVAVFTTTKGGLMAEASIGGQKFSYEAAEQVAGTLEE